MTSLRNFLLCLCSLLFFIYTLTGNNLIPNGDFEEESTYLYLSGNDYYIKMLKEGWDIKVLGPLFQPVPTFTPNQGVAKIRQIEGKDVFQGKRCLYIKTWNKDCSFYKPNAIISETLYNLSFHSKGAGKISFSAYVYKGNKVIEAPVFISISLTENWKKYETQIYIKNPQAEIASLVINVKPSTELFIDNIVLMKDRKNKGTK